MKRQKANGKAEYDLSLQIKDYYLCRGLMLNAKLNKHNKPELSRKDNEHETRKKLASQLQKKFPYIGETDRECVSFDEVLTIISEPELLKVLLWVKDDIDFALKTINDHELSKVNRKRREASILDEL